MVGFLPEPAAAHQRVDAGKRTFAMMTSQAELAQAFRPKAPARNARYFAAGIGVTFT
jgi:hypothetical protein